MKFLSNKKKPNVILSSMNMSMSMSAGQQKIFSSGNSINFKTRQEDNLIINTSMLKKKNVEVRETDNKLDEYSRRDKNKSDLQSLRFTSPNISFERQNLFSADKSNISNSNSRKPHYHYLSNTSPSPVLTRVPEALIKKAFDFYSPTIGAAIKENTNKMAETIYYMIN